MEIFGPLSNVESLLVAIALLSTRILVAFSMMPIFSENAVPLLVRISFVIGLSMCLLPMLSPQSILLNGDLGKLVPYLLKEAGIGFMLGFICSLVFWALHAAGTFIEYQAGLSMSTMIDPLSGRDDSMVGGLFMQLFNILFIVSGGLLAFIGMLFDSYKIWPIEKMLPLTGNLKLLGLFTHAIADMMGIIIKIAAPFIILMLIAELSLGLLSRFAPQLNAFFLALPIKILILSFLLLLFCYMFANDLRLLPDFSSTSKHLQEVL